MRPQNPDQGPKGAPEWMVTYSDVISLLVTFFVMLLTFSTTDREKFGKAAGALKGALGIAMSGMSRLPESGIISDRHLLGGRSSPTGVDFPPDTEKLARSVMAINVRIKNEKFGAPITMHFLSRGILLRISARLIFFENTAMFTSLGEEYLSKIAMSVEVVSNDIEIMTHAGPGFESTFHPSAWHLTQERSARMAEFFHKRWSIKPDRMTVGGMGDSRPLGRKLKARDERIEITLLTKQDEQ